MDLKVFITNRDSTCDECGELCTRAKAMGYTAGSGGS
jgi:hypothetical protein